MKKEIYDYIRPYLKTDRGLQSLAETIKETIFGAGIEYTPQTDWDYSDERLTDMGYYCVYDSDTHNNAIRIVAKNLDNIDENSLFCALLVNVITHEMVHHYNNLRGIRDCNGETQEHFPAFAKCAERFGVTLKGYLNEANCIMVPKAKEEIILKRVMEKRKLVVIP